MIPNFAGLREEFESGAARLRAANAAAGDELQLVTGLRLYATVEWLARQNM